MKATVEFGQPRDVTPGDLDGVIIRYPFSVTWEGDGARRDTVTQHKISVSISGTLVAMWDFGRFFDAQRSTPLVRTLFEYARQDVLQKVEEGRLGEHEELELYTNTAPNKNPFDPNKIPNPVGARYIIELPFFGSEEAPPQQIRPPSAPRVFVSYSWDSDPHRKWVLDLSTRLRSNGTDVILDHWHLAPGDRMAAFMETSIRESDLVLIVCTPPYKQKADKRTGGVGYEDSIMAGELLTERNERKFVPVLRGGLWVDCAPSWLLDKYYIDLNGDPYPEIRYRDLLATIHNQRPQAPPIGPVPDIVEDSEPTVTPEPDPTEPIRLEGIIADEVTQPRSDGTRGSGLYVVPFRLSRRPSSGWASAFVEAWDRPSRFTTMHRPGIARIEGDKVVLDGTTIEEVERYHRDTLNLALEAANRSTFG